MNREEFDMMKLPLPSDTMGIIDRMLAEKIVMKDEVVVLSIGSGGRTLGG